MARQKNTGVGRQISIGRHVYALAYQVARAEEREVLVVIERAIRAYSERSPEYRAQLGKPAVPVPKEAEPEMEVDLLSFRRATDGEAQVEPDGDPF